MFCPQADICHFKGSFDLGGRHKPRYVSILLAWKTFLEYSDVWKDAYNFERTSHYKLIHSLYVPSSNPWDGGLNFLSLPDSVTKTKCEYPDSPFIGTCTGWSLPLSSYWCYQPPQNANFPNSSPGSLTPRALSSYHGVPTVWWCALLRLYSSLS